MPERFAQAWAALHFAKPPGWYVGSPHYHDERDEWQLFAYDPLERAVDGIRKREWTAVARTEEGVVREMARCLAEISAGRVPKRTVRDQADETKRRSDRAVGGRG